MEGIKSLLNRCGFLEVVSDKPPVSWPAYDDIIDIILKTKDTGERISFTIPAKSLSIAGSCPGGMVYSFPGTIDWLPNGCSIDLDACEIKIRAKRNNQKKA